MLDRSALMGWSVTEEQKKKAKVALHEKGEGERVNGVGRGEVDAALQCNTTKGKT